MLAGTKKLMGTQYRNFCDTMLEAANNESLPASLQLDDTFGMTCQDIGDLCYEFEKDTGLELTAHFFVCHYCGKLHVIFEVDYPNEEEDEDTSYLQ